MAALTDVNKCFEKTKVLVLYSSLTSPELAFGPNLIVRSGEEVAKGLLAGYRFRV